MRLLIVALVLASAFASPAATYETWCWAPEASALRTCTYSAGQCREVVRLRRAGVCVRAGGARPHVNAAVRRGA